MANKSLFGAALDLVVFENTLQAYLTALVMFLALWVILSTGRRILLEHLGKLAQKTAHDLDDLVVGLVAQIKSPVLIAVALYAATTPLKLAESLRLGIKYFLVIMVSFRAIMILQEIIRYGVRKVYCGRVKPGDPSAEAMVNSVSGVLRWAVWLLGAIFILDNLGINITALMAGIGIGGIAVAMASQAILGDAFSAACIFLDRPFEVGDFIIVGENMGTVEKIGLKTTRLRSLSGEQLVFSNSDLTNSRIRNYKRMEIRRIVFKLGIVYQTPVAKVKQVPELLKDIFMHVKGVRLDRVHFSSFGDFSLNYEIVYFVLSADYNIYMDKQQEINFAIMDVFENAGIAFAYPTQTLYVNKEG